MCGNYSREETIQGRKLYEEIRYVKILTFLVTFCRYSTKRLDFDAKIPYITAISNKLSRHYDSENKILPDESRCE